MKYRYVIGPGRLPDLFTRWKQAIPPRSGRPRLQGALRTSFCLQVLRQARNSSFMLSRKWIHMLWSHKNFFSLKALQADETAARSGIFFEILRCTCIASLVPLWFKPSRPHRELNSVMPILRPDRTPFLQWTEPPRDLLDTMVLETELKIPQVVQWGLLPGCNRKQYYKIFELRPWRDIETCDSFFFRREPSRTQTPTPNLPLWKGGEIRHVPRKQRVKRTNRSGRRTWKSSTGSSGIPIMLH